MSFEGDLVINLTKNRNLHDNLSDFSSLTDCFTVNFKEIMVPWPDFGIPLVTKTFWQSVQKLAVKKGYKRACIQCGHSHGRTGTALSSLLIVNCGMSALDAVDLIREHHCHRAVESEEQCRYLLSLDHEFNDREYSLDNLPVGSMEIMMEKSQARKENEEAKESSG